MKEAQSLEIKKLTEKYAKAEFLSLMYPDKEALKASKIIDDLLELVMSGEVEFSHIASEITGVPLERIRAADEFWFNQLTE